MSKRFWFEFAMTAAVWLLAMAAVASLCGCGHNHLTYGDGFSVKTTVDPELWSAGVCVQYGKILSATVRENVVIEMRGDGEGKAAEGTADTSGKASGSVKMKVGSQVTGYTVDLERAKKQ